MRIGLDIDNVVSDFDKKVEYECAIEDRRKRNRGMVNPNADWIPRFYDWSYDEVEGFFEENMEEFAKVLELREGALEYMTKLMGGRARIVFDFSSCLSSLLQHLMVVQLLQEKQTM